MFDIGFSKILVIFGLALVVLGPEKLPRVAATVGRWVGRARVMARQFRDQLEQESEGLRKGADSFREAADGLRKGSDSFREAADGLRREFDPNAVPVPGKVPTRAPSPVPMSATPATPAEAPANPEALATPDPGERPPRHSDIDELVRDPAAPTPATPPPPKHEPGT